MRRKVFAAHAAKTFLLIYYAPLLRHVDRHTVGVGGLERATVAFGQELQANLALGAGGLGRQRRVAPRQRGQIFLKRLEIFDLEAEMVHVPRLDARARSEEHTSELQSPYVISYAVFC